jgi:hypothetical protein
LDTVEISTHSGLRDRALLAALAYTFARIGSVVNLKVEDYSLHSFRATGITNFLGNDGTLEAAQRIASHADSRTTKLYDRRGQKVLLEDMERIRY